MVHFLTRKTKAKVVVHRGNPRTWEAEASSRLVWSMHQVPDQPGLHSEIHTYLIHTYTHT